MKNTVVKTFSAWLPLSVAIVCTYGIMYLAIQQYIRLSANEVPQQIAEDIKEKLEQGLPVTEAIGSMENVNMEKSKAPFVMVFNAAGALTNTSASMGGVVAVPPGGVFSTAKQKGVNKITWQPKPGVRNATVTLPYAVNGHRGFVLAGKSLKGTEARERFLSIQIAAGLIITLFVTFLATLVVQYGREKLFILPSAG
jgi:hypothetical protein